MSKKNGFKRTYYIKRASAWVKSLFLLIFILLPAVIIWFFTSPDFGTNPFNFSLGIFFAISFGYIFYALITTVIFVYFKVLDLQIFYFVIPLILSLSGIYLSYDLFVWARFLISVILVLTAIPANIIVNRIENNFIWKSKLKQSLNKKKM